MNYKTVIPIYLVLQFVLCASKAQSTISVEYGRMYSSYENTGIYLNDVRLFKDQDIYTEFYSFGYQAQLFSNFRFETGVVAEYRKYDLAIQLDKKVDPPAYWSFYKGQISSWGVPLRINYELLIGRRFSLYPSIGFAMLFNEFSNNTNGTGHAWMKYSIGSAQYKIEYDMPKEKTQEEFVIVPNAGIQLNYRVYRQLDVFARAEYSMGFTTMHKVDYAVEYTGGNSTKEYKGHIINKGTATNTSVGLSYTFPRKPRTW